MTTATLSQPAPAANTGAPASARALEALMRRRRAAPGFRPDPVPREVIDRALHMAAEAPSGYNFQPWRFLVLRTAKQRALLRPAANSQNKILEAPVVIVATADRTEWRREIDEIFAESAERTGRPGGDLQRRKMDALAFISRMPPELWLTRQVMIAFTYLMLAVESLGWDTAPMEGFDASAVRHALQLPPTTEVIALLAIGRSIEPTVPHPGRLPVSRIAYDERHGREWTKPRRRPGDLDGEAVY